MEKLNKVRVDLNIAPLMVPVAHGTHKKVLVVLHETVSPDYGGLTDILGVARYMPRNGLGIHGIIDGEGNLAWDVFGDSHVLYHTASGENGRVNTWSIGIELISRVMMKYPDNQRRFEWWWQRAKQIEKCAKVLAYISHTHKLPLEWSDAKVPAYAVGDGMPQPGVTTHWQVSKTYDVKGGPAYPDGGGAHWDAWPKHRDGYFPALRIIHRARYWAKRGY